MKKGKIFDIQRFCLHDGPGIRTTVFLKGCPLRCPWCCNPESQKAEPELLYLKKKCLGCGRCIQVCQGKALVKGPDGFIHINREKCLGCGSCATTCPSEAIRLCGREMTTDEVMREIMKDRSFFEMSGGGVTFSGGESTAQTDFLTELLELCMKQGLHTAIETCGVCSPEQFKTIAKLCDLIYFDLKFPDNSGYEMVGGNRDIFKNLITAANCGKCIVRIPMIPLNNLSEGKRFGEVLQSLPLIKVELLPYHRLGISKYDELDREYSLSGLEPPSEEEIASFKNKLTNLLACNISVVKV